MDSIENTNLAQMPERNPSKGLGWKIFFAVVLAFSIIANLILALALVASTFLLTSDRGDHYLEKVLQKGRASSKIAVIRIEGIINNDLSEKVIKQIKAAREDNTVKAVIFKTITPGGAVAASDRIYDEICRFKAESGKPAVAFMETIATSGGYYTSCACDKIIAEPTTITGSIGVIMGHFVLQELLEQKLGIKPFIAKSGTKKDWPTTFEPVTEEQAAYLNNKLIMPAYERFVGIVAKSREDVLTEEQVKTLADGSIYNAPEALENKLIDDIGYIQEAIVLAESLANISNTKVVEYTEPFSIETLFGAQSIFKFNMDSLSSLTTPGLLYIWDAGFSQ
ncbi:MAG: signal peptide peptidase SppA [Phycisphaerae bacterium]|nr:signal peptide peptidase SppA [Phycisphaerae bacterium]